MNFDDFKLTFGFPVQLHVTAGDGSQQRLSCRLVGSVANSAIIVSWPREAGKAARLRNGQKLTARIMVANGICLFNAVVESSVSSPFPLVFLSYPASVSFKGIRGATRVEVSQMVDVLNNSSLEPVSSSGCVVDISTSGARIELQDAVAEIGDELSLSATLPVGDLKRSLSLGAVVRSRVERSTREVEENRPAVYGIEFTQNSEDDQLVLYAFVYAAMAQSHEAPHG